MSVLVLILVALAGVVTLTLFAVDDPGLITIARAPYEIQMSLALFIIYAVVAFVLLYILYRLLVRLARAPQDLRKYSARQRVEKAHTATLQGYAGLIEGDWAKAEKNLTRRLDHSPAPTLNYLGAAYAAQQRGDVARRDRYLNEAARKDPDNQFAIGLTKARLLARTGQLDEAGALLDKLRRYAPASPAVLRLLADVRCDAGDWRGVLELAPALRKTRAVPDTELWPLEMQAYRGLFGAPLSRPDRGPHLLDTWRSLSRAERRKPQVVALYARQLIENDAMAEAGKLLRNSLKHEWSSELAYLFGLVDTGQAARQYQQAERWAAAHPDDADLLLTLGRLAMRQQHWDRARAHLEAAIAAGGRNEAYRELGLLLEQLGDRDAALHYYRQGLAVLIPPSPKSLPRMASTSLVLAGEAVPLEAAASAADQPAAVASTANAKES